MVALGATLACGDGQAHKTTETAPETAAAPSASAPPSLEPDPPPPGAPVGTGFTSVVHASDAASGCKDASFEVAQYLQRGELTLAGRPTAGATGGDEGTMFAASYLVKLPNGRWQIAFAGYDDRARRVSRDRGIAYAAERAPKLFATGDQWTLAWFDDQGLAYARPTFAAGQKPDIDHLTAAKGIDPAQVALSSTPDGSLIVASHIGTNDDQLSVFLFAPLGQGQTTRAVGLTKAGKKPRDPAVAADGAGYTLAWLEADERIVATRLDSKGDQQGNGAVVAAAGPKRGELDLTRVKDGALLTWSEGERIFARKLDTSGRPSGDIVVVGEGKHPVVISGGDDAIVAFLAKVGEVPDQLLAVRVSASAAVSPRAVRISDGIKPVLDPPSIAIGGDRLGAVWTEVMSATIQSKRAWLRLIDTTCLE